MPAFLSGETSGDGALKGAVPIELPPYWRLSQRKDNTLKEKDAPRKSDTQGVAPTVTQGGAMPGGNENAANANAYPRADITKPGSVPRRIEESVGDPTGDKDRDQLYAKAQDLGLDVDPSMTRAELADAVKAELPS